MNLIQLYKNSIAQIENDRNREMELVRQRVTQEQIIPFSRDIDNSHREAVAELQNKLNDQIIKLQKEFEEEKKYLAEAAAKKKEAFAENTISTACYEINKKADGAIAVFTKLIEQEEK